MRSNYNEGTALHTLWQTLFDFHNFLYLLLTDSLKTKEAPFLSTDLGALAEVFELAPIYLTASN